MATLCEDRGSTRAGPERTDLLTLAVAAAGTEVRHMGGALSALIWAEAMRTKPLLVRARRCEAGGVKRSSDVANKVPAIITAFPP